MKYLIDTNAIISLVGKKSDVLIERVLGCDEGDIGISSIVSHELYYGAYKSQRISFNLETLRLLFADLAIIPFDQEDSRQAGEIRADLRKLGSPIGPYDVLIAGQARARNLILVSNNVSEFARVQGLKLEDWTKVGNNLT